MNIKTFWILCFSLISLLGKDDIMNIRDNGVYQDGELICNLDKATGGGSISDPTLGMAFRVKLYDNDSTNLNHNPKNNEEKVRINGFEYNEKAYTSDKEKIDGISLNCIDLYIDIDQGKNKGDYEVDIKSFEYKTEGNTDINICINLENQKKIEIIYRGPIVRDGYL